MSRHRGVQQMIDEAYAEEYAEDVDFGEDDELTEDDNEVINEVWEVVGSKYDKKGILEALDIVDWDVNDAINLLLNESSRFIKKKTNKRNSKDNIKPQTQSQQPAKGQGQPQKGQGQGQPKKGDLPTLTNQSSKEESKDTVDLKKHASSDELNPFRKESEDSGHLAEQSKFIDKTKFNAVAPDLSVDPKILEAVKSSKNLYVVVCGHVDSGKSTLVGHLLYDLGMVEKQTMHKYEKESTQIGKGSFKYAWILDERAEERQRGVTIEVGIRQVQTKHKNIFLLDSPGHQDFVSNMIGGTAQADTALLCIDSVQGAFDAGFCRGGQSQEHAILTRSMGIENIIVAVNKLDMVHWSEERYNYISSIVKPFLEEIGFKEENITMLPISGLNGENVFQRSKKEELGWYDGPCLLEVLDEMTLTPKNIRKPLRMVLNSVYNSTTGKAKGLCFSGKVESGIIEKGGKYVVMPACGQVTVKEILIDDEKVNHAISGDSVIVVIQAKEFDINNFKYGSIVCHIDYPMPVATKFIAEVEVFEFERPLIRGERTILHIGLNKISTVITKINYTIKKETGQVVKKNPRFLSKGDVANVEILCERGTGMELFKNYPLFGRVILREKERTIASGIIKEILE